MEQNSESDNQGPELLMDAKGFYYNPEYLTVLKNPNNVPKSGIRVPIWFWSDGKMLTPGDELPAYVKERLGTRNGSGAFVETIKS